MKKLLLIFLLLKLTDFASASHLMGGNLGYEYLGPSGGNFQYKIRLILYYNCDANSAIPNPEPNQNINIYLQDIPNNPMGGGNKTLHSAVNLLLVLAEPVEPPIASGCGIGQDVCINKGVYEGVISLPMNFNGYHLYFENFARNAGIVNLLNPGGTGMSFHAYIPPTLVNNSTPVFFDDPVPFLCLNDTTSILNTAFDPDGDQLIFSFVNPLAGSGGGNPLPWPITPVTYNAGFGVAQPFGVGGYSFINGSNGLTEYMSTLAGNFVVCVEIREYRNGNLIGVSRRDLQLLVINCPPNDEPVLTSNNGNVQFTIQECSQLCFPITFNDPDLDSISLEVSSPLDDNSQFNPIATFDTLVNTTSPVTSNFCWTPGCGTSQALPYLVIASATDNGCPPKTDNIIYEITVTPPTAPNIINGPNPVCANTTTTYTTNLISGYTYDWSITNGTIISGQGTNTITVEFPTAGSATLSVNSVNSCSCPSTDVLINITVLSAPVTNAGPDLNICIGDTATIGGTPTGPGGSVFSWSPSSTLTSSSIGNPGAFPTITTSYIVTVDNGSSCTNKDTVVVNVLSPTVDAGADVSICINDTTQLNASGAITYSWTPATGLSNPNISNPLAFPLVTTDYIVTGIGANGCSITDTITVTVNPIPVITITGDTEICLNDSTQLTASGGTTYLWSPGATLSNPNISNPFASPVSTSTYSVIVSTANGCSDTAQVTVIVNTLPVVIAVGDTSMCFGECQQLSATGANTYSWLPITGLNNPSISNPMACPTVSTLYTVTGTDANGCKDTDDVNIIIFPLPNANAGTDVAVCINDTVQLNASGGTIYNWSPATGLNSVVIANPLAFPVSTTTYTVTVTNANGCVDDDDVLVTVNPQPIVTISNDATICNLDTIQLNATGGTNYLWSPSLGLSATNIPNPLAFPNTTTTYSVIITDVNGCSDTVDVAITVNALPNVVAGNDTTMCIGECSQINSVGALSFVWLPSTGLNNASIPNPIACPIITTDYIVTGTDVNGCENSDTVSIIVNPLPIIDAGNDTSLCLNDTIQLNSTGGISYSWSPALGLSATNISNPLAFPLVTTTYIVTAIDANGCENSDTIIVTVNPLPIADAGIDLSICINDTIQIDGSGGLIYSWTPITGLDNPSAENPLAFPIITTNYILQVTDINSCTVKDSMILTVNSLPVVVASNDTSICLNDCAQLNATGAVNYSWTPILGLNNPSIANPLACPNVNTTYQVDGTDVNGCVNSDSVTISIFSLPIADAGIDLWLCPGNDIQLSGSGGIIFNWTPIADLNNPNISNPDANPIDTTEYILLVTDVNGCQDTDSMLVFVNDGVPVDAGTDRTICEGDSSQLGGTSTSPLGTIFLWTPSGTLDDPTSANPIAFPIVTTTYIVFVANDTCTNADTVTVFVNPTPIADAGADLQMCLNDSVQLQGTGGVQYVWTPAASLSNDSIANPFAFPISSTEYFVMVTDINGCVGYDSTNVTVFNLPVVDAGNDTAICIGDTAQLNGNSGFTSYTWTPGNTLDDSTIINPLAVPIQSTDYVLTVVDLNTCLNTDTVSVVVNLLPIVDAGNDTSLCIGSSIGLNATGGIIYVWTPGSTLSDSLISSPSAFPSSTEMYHVNVMDGNGCKNSDSVLVVVNLLPVVDAGNDTAICNGDQAQLNATSGFVQYDWNNGNSLSDSTIFNPTAAPTLTTEYFVTVTDNNGCVNFDSVTVTVHQLPNINAGSNINICRRDTVQLSASGGVSYIWTPNIAINDTSIQSPLVWPDTNTIYYLTGTDVFGCVNSDSILVNVFRVTGSPDTTICNGSSVQLFVNGPNAITWNWTPATGLNSSTIFNPIASPASSVSYVIAVTDNAGCRDTFAIDVDIVDPPIADFVYTVVPTCEGLLATFEDLSSGAQNYLWNFGDGTTDTTQNPTHVFIYNNTLTTTLITTNSFGCTDTITSSQPVLDFTDYYQITIPNVFTPNGDGVNDVYEIPMNGLFEDCMKFSVYNRWGKILYESDGVTILWDGKYNGEKIPNGVYYYILSINGIDFKGNMTILE